MGLCVGLVFNGLKRFDKPGTWSYIVSAMCAPGLNTLFFMGYIVLAFYGCDYIQNIVAATRANPFMSAVVLSRRAGYDGVRCPAFRRGIVTALVSKVPEVISGVRSQSGRPETDKNLIKSQAPSAFCRGAFFACPWKMPYGPKRTNTTLFSHLVDW